MWVKGNKMSNTPVNTKTLEEALTLSEEILTAIELETASLSSCMLKASRLARLLNDFEYQQIFMYENNGYPSTPKGVNQTIWKLCVKAKRNYIIEYEEEGKTIKKNRANLCSVDSVEAEIKILQENLKVSTDPNISINSANPKQSIPIPKGNQSERASIRFKVVERSKFIVKRKSFLHEYVSNKYYELKYAKISTDIFSRTRLIVDENIGKIVPDAMKQFASVYENLTSENTEDWSNAVNSCRRILQNTADALYPARDDKVIKLPKGKERTIKLGVGNYINRLVAYVEEHTDSGSFEKIVGSNISYLGERLDAIYNATNKGTHDTITTKEEADRYVIYTYLIIGDILSLMREDPKDSLSNNTEINS